MKFAFCVFKYFQFGGISRDLERIARECITRGHTARVYTLVWQALQIDGIEVVTVPTKGMTNHARYAHFAAWVATHLAEHPVDLVIGMNKMPGIDVYYAGDSCYEEKSRTQRHWFYRLTPRYRLFSRFERAVFGRDSATEVLTISEAQTPLFRRHYGTQWERLHALPPGIDRSRRAPVDYQQIRRAFRAEQGVGDHEHLLLFVGSGFIKKGLDRVIAGFAALPEPLRMASRLFVVGEDNAKPYAARIARAGLADRITFFQGRDDVPHFLFGADSLLLPAYDENTGTVILEAMIAGVPVLVTENCGYANYVEQAHAGLIVRIPYEQQSFNDKLVELLTSPQRHRWQRNGVAFGDRPEIYRLVESAVDRLEAFASGRYRRPAPKPEMAFCLWKYFPLGGLQHDFLRTALRCQALGFRVRIYTLSWQGRIPDGMDVVVVPARGISNHRRYARFASWVADALVKQPVICTVGFNPMPGLDVYYAGDVCHIDKADQRPNGGGWRNPRDRYFVDTERVVFERGGKTKIMLIAANQRGVFERHYATEPERFVLLPPGIERDRIVPDDAAQVRAALRAELGLGSDELLLLLVGSGFIGKGLDRSLIALAHLPQELKRRTRLIAIGQDNPRSFLRMAQHLKVSDRFVVLPARDDIPRFLQAADLLLHPAYAQTAGNVLLEAIVAGLPVLTTDTCGNAPFVERARAGRVVASPFRQQVFNELLVQALSDAEQRATWRRHGIEFGRATDLYSLPERAAQCIVEAAAGGAAHAASLGAGADHDRRTVSA